MATPDAPEAPNPDSLREFLRSTAPKNSVAFDVPPETAEEMRETAAQSQAQTEAPTERVEVPLNPVYEPDQATAANILNWTLQLPSLGPVTVTEDEKILYLKAVDNDTAVVFVIDIPIGPNHLKVEIRSRSVFEERSAFLALDIAAYERKDFYDPAAFATRAQQLCAAVQVLSVNGMPLTPLDLTPAGTDIRKAAALIESHASRVIETMAGPRWGAVLTALRIAEVKIKLCNENANNESFWIPAS